MSLLSAGKPHGRSATENRDAFVRGEGPTWSARSVRLDQAYRTMHVCALGTAWRIVVSMCTGYRVLPILGGKDVSFVYTCVHRESMLAGDGGEEDVCMSGCYLRSVS